MKGLQNKLNTIKESGNELTKYVIDDILAQGKDYQDGYIKDVLEHGCSSGAVGGLIYYNDTTAFYDKYNEEIYNLLEELRQSLGNPNILSVIADFNGAQDVGSDTQYKNLLAWFGYEESMRHIAEELNIEY